MSDDRINSPCTVLIEQGTSMGVETHDRDNETIHDSTAIHQLVSSCDMISSRTTMSCTNTVRRLGRRVVGGSGGDRGGNSPVRKWPGWRWCTSRFGTGRTHAAGAVAMSATPSQAWSDDDDDVHRVWGWPPQSGSVPDKVGR